MKIEKLEHERTKIEFAYDLHYWASLIFTFFTTLFCVLTVVLDHNKNMKSIALGSSCMIFILQLSESFLINRQRLIEVYHEIQKINENP